MPEIKHQFTGGKMNKDLDERLVPNGEYRDAMNIQVSTSEGSAVGTVQNIMGNTDLTSFLSSSVPSGSKCVASIADESNNRLYWFGTNNTISFILALYDNHGTLGIKHIFTDIDNSVLEFNTNRLITGVSIVDDMLFWTDNHSEPRKINITRSEFGTSGFSLTTRLINDAQDISLSSNITIKKENITVIKKYPSSAPSIKLLSERQVGMTTYGTPLPIIYTGIVTATHPFQGGNSNNLSSFNANNTQSRHDFSNIGIGSKFPMVINTDINGESGFYLDWNVGDTLLIKEFTDGIAPSIPLSNYTIKGKIYDSGWNNKTDAITESLSNGDFVIPSSGGTKPLDWVWDTNVAINYNAADNVIEVVDAPKWHKIHTTPTTALAIDEVHKLTLELEDVIDGKIQGMIVLDHPTVTGDQLLWPTTYESTSGIHEDIITLSEASAITRSDFGFYEGKFILQTNNLDPELISMGEGTPQQSTTVGTHAGGDEWEILSSTEVSFDHTKIDVGNSSNTTIRFMNIQEEDRVDGVSHTITLKISNYTDVQGFHFYGYIGVYVQGGIPVSMKVYAPGFLGTMEPGSVQMDGTGIAEVTTTFNSDSNGRVDIEIVNTSASTDPLTSTNGCTADIEILLHENDHQFSGNVKSVSLERQDIASARVAFEVTAINGTPPSVEFGETELNFAIDKLDDQEKLFEFKFPRFAYRYKYEDGEYSTFSPFSEVAFLPGSFDYHPKKGYNLGMTNKINRVEVRDFITNIPLDVTAVDILYKEDDSPNIYIVNTVKKGTDWNNNLYVIESEAIKQVLPSNQLLRHWDNVPKKALSQDVTGSRIVYGNYEQGYDLIDSSNNDYYPNLDFSFKSNNVLSATKSIKSLREYQLGVVFVDEYGRETPVISNSQGSKRLNKIEGSKANTINASFLDTKSVGGMKYFKFFVKETSGEYYNMAMDRFWDAGDEHAWVSFPSSDRNKVDIDTFLILKKGIETNVLVTDPARYKVLAIENEAPDFIKTKKTLIEEVKHVYATKDIFGNTLDDIPISGRKEFKMNYQPFMNSSGSKLHEIEDTLYVEFTMIGGQANSKRYRITSITTDYDSALTNAATSTYNVKLDEPFEEDVDFISSSTKIYDGAIVKIYKYKIENSKEFDGRFFVKLLNDDIFTNNITQRAAVDLDYRVITSKKLYNIKDHDKHKLSHARNLTGHEDGVYGGMDFGFYACYFRNYNQAAINASAIIYQGGSENIGQYAFGSGDKWLTEFKQFTSSGSNNTAYNPNGYWAADHGFWAGTGPALLRQFTKIADVAAKDESVWFIDNGTVVGQRDGDDNLNWTYISQADKTRDGISRTGSNSYSYLNIGIGGIYDSEINDDNNKSLSDLFGIGVDGGNSNYQGSNVKNLVSKFNPGIHFKFKEDPNSNVYLISPSVTYQRSLRYHDGTLNTEPAQPLTSFPWSNSTAYSDSPNNVAQLSPNFTKNWVLKIKNLNDTNTHVVEWDPTNGNTLGPISGGRTITLTRSSTVVSATSPQYSFVVGDLTAYDNFGVLYSLNEAEPMIITSYTSSSGTKILDSGTVNSEPLIIKKITDNNNGTWTIDVCGYVRLLNSSHIIHTAATSIQSGGSIVLQQPAMNGYSQWSANRINIHSDDFAIDDPGLMAVGYDIQFVEAINTESELPDNPAIWETEPKKATTNIDIYHEASGLNPISLSEETKNLVVPIGSKVSHPGTNLIDSDTTVTVFDASGKITFSKNIPVGPGFVDSGDDLLITKLDGSTVLYTIDSVGTPAGGSVFADNVTINTSLYSSNTTYGLSWFNCYAFGNGVESNRIRDNFNLPYISNGVKASSTLDEGEYKNERRKYGLIYSGLYNSTSRVNNLNQFIAAEKITKDVNPIYGSIQKLHSRSTADGDLIALCEDRVLKILANKDAVYNADGNPQLTANENVLGQTIPFSGEFGISKNPESFASESYRVYFTDKVRGAVMRLSKDGLTPISDHGMKDWFRDNLKLSTKLIGSYDDRNDEYNITLEGDPSIVSRDTPGYPTTVSFKEDVRGWVSFKSFIPDNGISMANDYYTFKGTGLFQHYNHPLGFRNTFYGTFENSSVNILLNDGPGSVKSFHTLGYEGSQSKIDKFTTNAAGLSDDQPYNLVDVDGWYVSGIETDKQVGSLNEFIEKEGKWFNYIKGVDSDVSSETDFAASNIQGIGILSSINSNVLTLNSINISLQVGDIIYYQTPGTNGSFDTIDSSSITKYGDVDSITNNTITVSPTGTPPTIGDFIFFAKNNVVNTSSLLGYYADVKLENDSKVKAEIFSISSEVTESSK